MPFGSWDNTLRRLGLIKRKIQRPRQDFRRPLVEQLETRDLLTTVDVSLVNSAGEPSGTGKFRIERDGDLMMPLTVGLSFSGTATWSPGTFQFGDYWTMDASNPTDRTIPAGEPFVEVEFNVINDSDPEGTETVILTVFPGTGYTVGTASATANLTDDDVTTVNITATDNQASEAGQDPGTFTITRSPVSSSALTVNFARSGTATYSTDYSAPSPTSVTIPANTSSTTVTITPVDDVIYESGGESVIYTLSSGSGYQVGSPSSATITIAENDSAPSLSISNWTDLESQNASFAVSLSGPNSQTITVNYASQNGTAIGGSDYTGVSGVLTFTPGDVSESIPVTIAHDGADELNESFTVTLSGASGASISDGTGIGTIIDDDGPTVSINDVQVNEGGTATFTVSISAASPQVITLDFATQDWDAWEPDDYSPMTGTLTFSANDASSKTIEVSTQGDSLNEDNERFKVLLSNLTNAYFNDNLGVATILDDDPLPTLSVNSVSVSESAGTATFTVTLAPASGRAVSVNYATSDQTAESSSDYTAASGLLSFPAGQTTKTFSVPITNDLSDEDNETYLVTLSSATNASISSGSGTGTGTITDNDAAPELTIDNPTVSESDGNLVFTVHVSEPSGKQITVDYQSSDISAQTAEGDYTAVNSTLTISPGSPTATITVPVGADSLDEFDETLRLTLSNAVNATIAGDPAIGTIDDDDGPGISINDISVNETAESAVFTISIPTASQQQVRVNWATSPGSATAGSDYATASGTAIISVGSTSTTISVAILNDNRDEDDQTFNVTLSNPVDASITDGTGVATIIDEDAPPSLSINDKSREEDDAAMTFTVTLSPASEKTVTVQYGTSDISATGNVDYFNTAGTLTFSPMTTSLPLAVTIKSDMADEIDETFKMLLSIPVNASIGDGEGIGTIDDNDGPNISIASITVPESIGTAVLTVTLSASSYQDVYVGYETQNGSAVAPSDYGTTSGTLHFPPNTTTRTISVSIVNDTEDEVDEQFSVNLFSPVDGFLGEEGSSATVTIDDNDGPKIYVDDATVIEGTGSTKTLVFPVRLNAASQQTVTVDYHTSDLSATAPSDYTGASGTVTFLPGQTARTVSVSIVTDSGDEADETLQLDLEDPIDATIEDGTAIGTIDDDDGPIVSIGDASGSESTTPLNFTVTLSAVSPQDVVVTYSAIGDTAVAGLDFTGTASSTITIPQGTLSVPLPVTILSDTLDEVDETFRVTLLSAVDATVSEQFNTGTGTIVDDDEPPEIEIADIQVTEDAGQARFTVRLSNPSGKQVSVLLVTDDGNASASSDYTFTLNTVSFAIGDIEEYFDVPIINDTVPEPDEVFYVILSDAVNATIPDNVASATILDNEPRVKIESIDWDAGELNSGSNPGKFRITKTGNAANTMMPLTVYYQVSGSATNGQDYSGLAGWVELAASGPDTEDIDISVLNDAYREGMENVILTLQTNSSYTIEPNMETAEVAIDDNDEWSVSISAVDPDAYEVGPTRGKFAITRSGETDNSQPLTVGLQLSGDATLNTDYSFSPSFMGQVTIPANQWTAYIEVVPVLDSEPENPPEKVILTIQTDSSHYAIGTASATVSIHDGALNDPPTIDPISNITIDEDSPQQTVSLSGITAGYEETQVLTVMANTDDTALITGLAVDYTSADTTGSLHFTPGPDQNGAATITVTVTDDGGASTSVSFTVTVTPVNDPPHAGHVDLQVDEDANYQSLTLIGDDGDSTSQELRYKVLSLPAHGTIRAPGGSVITSPGTTLTSPNLEYKPSENYSGPDGFTYEVSEVSSGLVANPNGDVAIDVRAIDDAPVVHAPIWTVYVQEGIPFAFTGETTGFGPNDIFVTDIDAGEGIIRTTLGVSEGELALDVAGLHYSEGDPGGDDFFYLEGTVAQINAALAGLTYTYTDDNPQNPVVLTIVANDRGNTGAGGPKEDTKTVNISVIDVNDPPVNHLPPEPFWAPAGKIWPIPGLSVSDPDIGNATIRVQVSLSSGELYVNGVNAPFDVTDTLANVNALLATISIKGNCSQVTETYLHMDSDDLGHNGVVYGTTQDHDILTIKLIDVPVVSLTVPDPDAYEEDPNPNQNPDPPLDGPQTGKFNVKREYCCEENLAQALNVQYGIIKVGNQVATPGHDYIPLLGTVAIPANSDNEDIIVRPFIDFIMEGDEYVPIYLIQPPGTYSSPPPYLVDSTSVKTVTIHNFAWLYGPEVTQIAMAATDAYLAETKSGELADNGEVVFTRGEQNIGDSEKVFFKLEESGEDIAIVDQDFTVDGAQRTTQDPTIWFTTIPAGVSSTTVYFNPIDDETNEWDEKIQVSLVLTDPETNEPVDYLPVGSTFADMVLFDNDGFAEDENGAPKTGLQNRNLDRDSTNLAREQLGNGTIAVDVYEGEVSFGVNLPGSVSPVYQGDDNLQPLLPVEWELPAGVTPSSVTAATMFANLVGPSVTIQASTSISATSGPLRYVVPTSEQIKDELTTGHYDYHIQIKVGDHVRTIRGRTEVINTVSDTKGDTELGKRWRLGEVDRLYPDDGNTAQFTDKGLAVVPGQAVIRGDNTSGFFESKITDKNVNNNPEFGSEEEWHDGTYASSQPYKYTTSTDQAKWTFEDLEADQQYQVFATWVPGPTRTPAAQYKVKGTPFDSTDTSKTVTVNQQFTPGEVLESGQYWRSLGYYTANDEGKIIVELTGSGGETVAQSVMLASKWSFEKPPVGTFSQLVYEDSSSANDKKRFILKDKHGGKAEFNDQGLLTRREDRNANETSYEYTAGGDDNLENDLSKITRQGNLQTEFNYASGHLVEVVDFAGRGAHFNVDGDGLLSSLELPPPESGSQSPTYYFHYNGPADQLSFVEDPLDNYSTIDYDQDTKRVKEVVNPDGNPWQLAPFIVDGVAGSSGSAQVRKPATGLIGQNEIDAALPAGSLKEPRATYTDPHGNDWVYQTDALGLTTALAKPETQEIQTEDVWKWERRPDGLATKYTQPAGGGGNAALSYDLVTLYDEYDSKGNLLHVEYPDETTQSWQYNGQFAVVTKFTDQLNRETEYELDSRGNVEYIKTMEGGSPARQLRTQYTAQPDDITDLPGGLPTQITVAYGTSDAVTTLSEYFTSGSKVGLAKKVTHALASPVAEIVEYDYDEHRNLVSTKNAIQPATTSEYDDLNRLLKITYPAPTAGADAPFATFQYDALGNVEETRDVRGVVSKTRYDEMNRVEYVDAPPNGGSQESNQTDQTTQNFYDEVGNLTKVKYPVDREATFAYDARNQHVKTTLPAPDITLPAGMSVPLPGAPITNYSYDALGNLRSVSDPRNAAWKTTYDYDDLNRRYHTSEPATADHGATEYVTELDEVGRVISTHAPGPNGGLVSTDYAYDRFDRLVTKTPPADAMGRVATETLTYDLRNNVLSVSVAGRTTESTYDQRNRPLTVTSPDPGNGLGRLVVQNAYNAIGQVIVTEQFAEGNPSQKLTNVPVYDNLGRVIQSTGTDPDGNGPLVAQVATNIYDAGGNVLQSQVTGGSQSILVNTDYDNYSRPWRVLGTPVGSARTETISLYGAAGENFRTLERVSGTAWRTFDYAFDKLGRLFSTTGPADGGGNRPTTYSVADEAGNVTAIRNALGHVTTFAFDTLSRLKQIVEPAVAGQAKTTSLVYNPASLVAAVTDPLQRTVSSLFDNVGNLMQTALPTLGGVTPLLTHTYDVLGNLTGQTDVQGNTTSYVYDGLSRLVQTSFPAAGAATGGGSSFEGSDYLVDDGDSNFSVLGTWTTHSADPLGFEDDFRTTTTPGDQAQYVFTVAPGKRYQILATWKEASGNSQAAQYQWFDGMTQEGSATINQQLSPDDWDLDSQIWETLGIADVATGGSQNFTVRLSAGASGTSVADAIRLIEVGPQSSLVYDGLGRVIARTNELGQTTTYAYDLAGNQTLVTLPDPDGNGPLESSFTASAYDSLGQLVAQWNAANETTLFGYNARGERTSITDPTNNTTLLGYDLLGRNTSVTDPAGNVTTFQFDDLDRKIGETQHYFGGGSSTRSFGYDLAGNRTLSVDRNGRATVYSYDARNQLYSEAWFGSLADANNNFNQLGGTTYSYDLAGRLTQAGSYAYGYDILDRLVSETSGHVPGGVTLTTSFGNRLDGLRQSVVATIGGVADFANQYSYDARLQMTQILQGGVAGGHTVAPKRVDFVHGADGRLDNITRFADLAGTQTAVQTIFAYDNQDRLTGINHFKASTTLAQYGFTYDTAGRINGFSSPDGTAVYGYNDRGELTGADYTGTTQPADAVYSYDANGNRADAGFTIGGHNQPTTDANFVYTYDAEGNRTSRTSLTSGDYDTYSWDNRNRLIQVAHRAADHTLLWTVDYAYDHGNRMIERVETLAGQSPTIERFVYDGNQIVLQANGSGAVTHRYLWGESVDQILADESVDFVSGIGTTRWTLTDHLNTVRDIATYNSTNNTTSIVDHIIYDAFGKVASESSPANSTDLKFTGHFTDPLTGLQWNLHRWYDPALHQWLSIDPILFDAGDPNPRRYVNNDPVNKIDPSGLAGGDNAFAQEGRVIGEAIKEMLRSQQEARTEVPVKRVFTIDGKQYSLDGRIDVGADGLRTIAAEIGPASPTGLKLKVAQANSVTPRANVILYEQTGTVPGIASQSKFVELSNKAANDLLATVQSEEMSASKIWSKVSSEHSVRVTTVSETAFNAAGNNYFRGVKAGASSNSRSAVSRASRRGVLDIMPEYSASEPPASRIFNSALDRLPTTGTVATIASDLNVGLWVVATTYEHIQFGKSENEVELGSELATSYANPLMWVYHYNNGGFIANHNRIDVINSQITDSQSEYIHVVSQALQNGGSVGDYGIRKARGYMDSQLHYMSMIRPAGMSMDEWWRFRIEYTGIHGNRDVEEMYNRWIASGKSGRDSTPSFPRTGYKFDPENE